MRRGLLILGPLPPPPGGVSVNVVREASGLDAAGISCTVSGLGGWFPEGFTLRSLVRAVAGTAVAMCRSLFGDRSAVHLHHSRWFYSLPVLAMIRLRGTPCAVTVHSESLVEDLERIPGPLASLMVRLLSGVALLIPVSDRVREGLASTGIRPGKVEVIPAFLPPSTEETDPSELGTSAQALHRELVGGGGRILAASAYNLGPGYGQEDLYGLELLAEALSGWDPEHPVTLVVGVSRNVSGPEQERSERRLRELLDGSGVRLELLFGEPLLPFLAIADGYIRPSREDGDSVAVREAMALGVPVAASDVTRRPEGTTVFSLDAEAVRAEVAALMDRGPEVAGSPTGSDPGLFSVLDGLVGETTPVR